VLSAQASIESFLEAETKYKAETKAEKAQKLLIALRFVVGQAHRRVQVLAGSKRLLTG